MKNIVKPISWIGSIFKKKKVEKPDEVFFMDLITDADWWSIKHYGDCLRFARTGFYMTTTIGPNPEEMIVKLLFREGFVALQKNIRLLPEEDYIQEIRCFMIEVMRFLHRESYPEYRLWMNQLRSSEDAAQLVESKTRII